MTSDPRPRRIFSRWPRTARRERFAELVEVGEALGADTEAELVSMVAVTGALRSAGAATATATDTEFRGRLRQRLVAVATVQGAGTATDAPSAAARQDTAKRARTQRRVTAFAGAFAIVVSLAGVGVAASRSLPGEPFFGVKRATEDAQLWATHGNGAKGRRHLEFAQTRLAEAAKLSPKSTYLATNLAAMDTQTQQGATELIAAYKSSKSPTPLRELLTFVHQQYAGIAHLATTVPTTVRVAEQKAAALLASIVTQVHTVSQNICLLCSRR